MEHRECPNCGNDLLITEQHCAYCGSANPYYEAPRQDAVVPAPTVSQTGSDTVYEGTLVPAASSSTAAVDPAYATKYSTKTSKVDKSDVLEVIGAIFVTLLIGIKWCGKAIWFVFKWTVKIFWFVCKWFFIGIAAIFKIIF